MGTMKTVFTKVGIDQIAWNPIFGIVFFTSLGLMEGKSTDDIQTKIKNDLPTAAGRPGRRQVVLDLGLDVVRGLALHEAERGEEDDAEDGVPRDLVNTNLCKHRLHGRPRQHLVEEAVEVVARRAV